MLKLNYLILTQQTLYKKQKSVKILKTIYKVFKVYYYKKDYELENGVII